MAYVFLCDISTEAECLDRKLVGTTQQNALWALRIGPGDTLFIYNFQTGVFHGPLIACSTTDCHESEAWGGRFPVQVQFDLAKGYRSLRLTERISPEILRRLRHGGPLSRVNEQELLKLTAHN